MEIIAKTEDGYLIAAKTNEVQEILKALNGTLPDNLDIGQELPAIDYAATITKVKTLKDNYVFGVMCSRIESFYENMVKLQKVIEDAENIEI